VLDGQDDSSSVFIFQAPFSGTGLTVGSGSTISLINGAQACNVFWRVDSADIGTTANFTGTILALNSITVANGATIQGRLLARNGDVTLINDTITSSSCTGNDTAGGNGAITPVPGLPNTGRTSSHATLGIAVASASLLVVLAAAYVAHKKLS
jgi:hypothetical protein